MNTLKYAKKLEDTGFTREQAEMTIGILNEVVEADLATKQDMKDVRREMRGMKSELQIEIREVKTELQTEIREVKTELQTEIRELRTEIKHDLHQLKSELTIKLGAMLVTAVLVMSAIDKLL